MIEFTIGFLFGCFFAFLVMVAFVFFIIKKVIIDEVKEVQPAPEMPLKLQLIVAEQCEDYEEAARLRDLIKLEMKNNI